MSMSICTYLQKLDTDKVFLGKIESNMTTGLNSNVRKRVLAIYPGGRNPGEDQQHTVAISGMAWPNRLAFSFFKPRPEAM